ncbi:MAG: chloride channel protein [Polyangiaceae bacterium]
MRPRSRWGARLRPVRQRLRRLLELRRLYWWRWELNFAPSEAQRLFALTVGIGVLCGLAAVAFHLSIETLEHALIERALWAPGNSWIGWTLLVPTLGGLVCGVLLHKLVPAARGSGIPQVKVAFARDGGRVRLRDAIGKFVIGSLQIGSGASLGREGPTVQICAGVASRLGRWFGVSPKTERRLLPVGVAAGIAAAFNAPIAAVTFTIEEVVGNLDQAVLSGVIVAAALAAVIERSLLGENAVFDVPGSYGLRHPSSLLVYALLGILAAVVASLFTESLLWMRARFQKMSRVPPWARPALGGFATGALAVVAMLAFAAHGITGGGYATLGQALTGELTLKVLVALCGLKLVATVFSYSSGGAGGIFAPSLFIGGTLGGAVGFIDSHWLQHSSDSTGAFALVGMGAVFAGVVRAPITSVLIIIEMTRGYSLILPLMIANMTAYVLARRVRSESIYEALLAQDGITLKAASAVDVLELGLIHGAASLSHEFQTFSLSLGASAICAAAGAAGTQRVYPVVDADNQLLGIVTTDEIEILRSEPDLLPLANAADMMRSPVSVHPDDSLRRAFEAMLSHGIRELPVTDHNGHLLGFLGESAIAAALSRARSELKPEAR